MPTITFMPDRKIVSVRGGISILNAARMHRVPIRTRCQGQASCLMCKVQILDEASRQSVSRPNAREERKLGDRLAEGYRLACQTIIHGDTVVTIPEDPLKAIVRAKLAEQQQEELW